MHEVVTHTAGSTIPASWNQGRAKEEETETFLASVWGSKANRGGKGVFFIATRKNGGGFRQTPITTISEAVSNADESNRQGKDVYFACASFLTGESRKADNARGAWAFWADIDCGAEKAQESKGYEDKVTAEAALNQFCDDSGLPLPNLITDSGNGIHCYWVFDQFINREVWQRYARILKEEAKRRGFLIDPARTADIASLMRVPGTTNQKDPENPKPVRMLRCEGVLGLNKFTNALPAADNSSALISLNDDLIAGLGRQPPSETPEEIERVEAMLKVIPADCSYEDWRQVVWSVMSTGWVCAEELAHDWSRTAPHRFEEKTFKTVADNFDPDKGIGFGTLVHYARENGYVEPVDVSTELAMIGGSQDAVAELNARYFVAKVGGGVYVFDESDENILAGGMAFTAFTQFRAGSLNGAKGAKDWLYSPRRRTFDGVVFDPSENAYRKKYNLYKGLALIPVAGSYTKILKHIEIVWCGGNQGQLAYVIKWMAKLVQKPWLKPEVALVLRSVEGAGKTIVVDILLTIFGRHGFVAAQKDQVAGRFNGHLFDKILVVLEEAFFAGDHAAIAATKALVTNARIGYEAKNKDAFSAPNYAHVISMTNNDWAVPAGADARRWMVLDVSDKLKGKYEYFDKLAYEIKNGGREAFLHYLMNIDIDGWNPRVLPTSNALQQQQVQTILQTDPVKGWWLHVLSEGEFTLTDGGLVWPNEISAHDMRESYKLATDRARNAPSWDVAAKQLRAIVPAGSLKKIRKAGHSSRSLSYQLPDLDAARRYFKSITGIDPCKV